MARVNNLSNFLTDVASAIKTKKGSETNIPAANFDTEILALPSQGVYEQRVLNISANGTQTITPSSGYDAINELELTIAVPEKQLQSKTYNFAQNTNIQLLPDSGYDGFDTVTLNINVVDPEYATNLSLSQQILGSVALPYIPLEYIQSTGTQYINTNTLGNGNTKVELELAMSSMDTSGSAIIGARSDYRSKAFLLSMYRGGWFVFGNNQETELNINYTINTDYAIKIDKNIVYSKTLPNEPEYTQKGSLASQTFTTDYNLILFAENFQNTITHYSSMKLYKCKIYNDTTLVRDFIPVKRNSDNKVCLYDKVTDQFFINAGTGYFIAGPEVN